jgi:hypothetical protein
MVDFDNDRLLPMEANTQQPDNTATQSNACTIPNFCTVNEPNAFNTQHIHTVNQTSDSPPDPQILPLAKNLNGTSTTLALKNSAQFFPKKSTLVVQLTPRSK